MIHKLISLIRNFFRINWVKTLWINYKMLPLGKAIHLPLLLFGRVKIWSLSGKIVIDDPVTFGMVKVGYKWIDLWPSSMLPTQINVTGTLVFKGSCIISGGVSLVIQSKIASCEIGDNCVVGGGSIIKSLDTITIGDYTRITGNCTVMNSNMHYVKNIETGLIQKTWGRITIGSHCWINQGTTITKGAVIPDYSVVARNSFLNKDYSQQGSNAFIVGSPAQVKNNHTQRIFSLRKEAELKAYFLANPEAEFFDDGVGIYVENNEKVF